MSYLKYFLDKILRYFVKSFLEKVLRYFMKSFLDQVLRYFVKYFLDNVLPQNAGTVGSCQRSHFTEHRSKIKTTKCQEFGISSKHNI